MNTKNPQVDEQMCCCVAVPPPSPAVLLMLMSEHPSSSSCSPPCMYAPLLASERPRYKLSLRSRQISVQNEKDMAKIHFTHTHTRGRSGSRLRRNEGSSGNLKIREFSTNDGSDHRCRSLNGAGAYAAVRRSCNLRPGLRARLMARKHKWAKCPWAKTPTGSHVMRSRDAKNHDS